MNDKYSITLHGFDTKEQAQMFLDWFDGQGEQDITYWIECGENLNGLRYVGVNNLVKEKWNGNTLEAQLKMTY